MAAIIRRQLTPQIRTSFSEDIPPLLKRVYASRNLLSDDDISLSISALLPPSTLKGLGSATELLVSALERSARILVVGDFDADGATSCALAIRALESMGHENVRFLVPNRFDYGYGLTPEIVELALQQHPDLIVTVDNGISSVEGVAAARKSGVDVLVTDHHLPGQVLPDANAIVNPNQEGCLFPSKALAGVGVLFYVMLALRSELRNRGWFTERRPEPNMADFLDLVALGTVADVVPLDKNNRVLVEQGLRRIRIGKACLGIQALINVSGRSAARITSSDLGFALGPRLNAAGRLDDISIGIACLLSNDETMALDIATELDAMNKDRRQIERSMQLQAEAFLSDLSKRPDKDLPIGMCLFDSQWHQGVVGILASRIKERYSRPVICFAVADDDVSDRLKGSARSVDGFHIRDALDAIAARFPDLIEKFGGHSMAAGLSLSREDFELFSKAFNEEVARHLSEQDLKSIVFSDGALKLEEINIDNAEMLDRAMPWGQALPAPVFDGEFYLVQQRLVASKHLKLVLRMVNGQDDIFDAIAFNIDTDDWPDASTERVKVAYRLDVNRYRGRESVQFIVLSIEKVK